jgi:hypothetical protein
MIYKIIKTLYINIRHKAAVFRACFAAGLYMQAFTHDLSKFSFVEFFEYAKYYNGKISPVDKAKQIKGYCNAWLHHRGHNPHHYEYWIDNLDNGGIALIMPYKYAMEMVCDWIGAGKAYNPAGWTISEPLKYWETKKKTAKIHNALIPFFDEIFLKFSKDGYKALNKFDTEFAYEQSIINWNMVTP